MVSSWAASVGLASFPRMFEALFLACSEARLDAEGLALGVWPLPLGHESMVRGHSAVLWEACAGSRRSPPALREGTLPREIDS